MYSREISFIPIASYYRVITYLVCGQPYMGSNQCQK